MAAPSQASATPSRSRRRGRSRVVPLEKVPSRRLWMVFLVLSAGLIGLAGRMAWLQLVQTLSLIHI